MTREELNAKIKQIKELQVFIDQLNTEMESLKDEVKSEMGDRQEMFTDEYKIRWTDVSSIRVNSKVLQEKYPDVYNNVTYNSHSRRFFIS